MVQKFTKELAIVHSEYLNTVTSEVLRDHCVPNDVLTRAYVLSALVKCYDEDVLVALGLDRITLRFVGERLRQAKIWSGGEVLPDLDGVFFFPETGPFTTGDCYCVEADGWLHFFTSKKAADRFRFHCRLSELAKIALGPIPPSTDLEGPTLKAPASPLEPRCG